jgi:phosphate transport system substrate-binding protein
MPNLLPRPLPRRARLVLILPATAGLLALAAGCTTVPAATSTRAASAAAVTATRISGAGSTFDAPFFRLAFQAYQQARAGITVSYAPVGSSAGITRFTAGQVDLGATDVPASTTDLATARGAAVQVPVDLGAVSVSYNALSRSSGPLRLTGPVLARIFLGQITRWNDPAITALNPGAGLPDAYITVVHRSDGSGTTYIFSSYLSAVSPSWQPRPAPAEA